MFVIQSIFAKYEYAYFQSICIAIKVASIFQWCCMERDKVAMYMMMPYTWKRGV